MIAKLWDDANGVWIYIDNVREARKYGSPFSLEPKKDEASDAEVTGLTAVGYGRPNPMPKNWKPRKIYLQRVHVNLENDPNRTFKVCDLLIRQPDGTDKYETVGFVSGFLLNDEGKTIERL